MKQAVMSFLAMVLVLAACAPAAQDEVGLQVALVNAPADERVPFLADSLQQETLGLADCCAFDFIRPAPIRFQETHRNLFGSRAAPQSASLARNLGAEVAVMTSAPRFERTVEDVNGAREVSGVVQLQATAVDAETGETIGSVGSLTFRGSRVEEADEPLPEVEEDPTMMALAEDAVADMAPHLAALLADIAAQYAPVR